MEYIKGDILTSEDDVIIHGCNAMGVMGAGLALSIKNKFPIVYEKYRKKYLGDGLFLGEIIPVEIKPNKFIVNCITQEYFGRSGVYVDYSAIEQCLKRLNNWCREKNLKSVSSPKIGAGLGGGNWSKIEKIIKDNLKDLKVTIYEL